MSAAAFPAETPAEVTDVLGRYHTRTYANGYQLTYEYAVAVADGRLRVEYRQLAAEALGEDAAPLAGVPVWVVTRTADPDGAAIFASNDRREVMAAYRAALAAQAAE